MLKKRILISVTFICLSLAGFAQEICNNGIDDDGDGLIDCYDPQCSGNPACSTFFYGKPVIACSSAPVNPSFNLNNIWQSTIDVSTRSTMMVGDVDGDGTPEVVCHQSGVNELYVLDGVTGATEVTITCPPIDDHVDAIAIGDTDGDGLGEIYVVTNDNKIRCFENNGTPKVGYTPPSTNFTSESIIGIADFNGDGVPEVYKDNRIYHSLTGALIAAGSGSTGQNPGANGSPEAMPVAADVLPASYCPDCAGLELVCGNVVYSVNIGTATITPIANSLPGSLDDGFTSVADMNLDGQLDVVVVSNGKIYVWDPRTGLQLGNTFNMPGTSGGGRANIADYDNDGIPEIGAGGSDIYVVVDVTVSPFALSQKWIKTIVDGSQHTTGSVFDFDCDGAVEVVYRDENNLFVWDGATGNVKAQIQCGSATRSEFPTIVDVDGDGQVNIVCACASGNGGSAGKVKAYNSSTNQWVGSRKVMNQDSYSVVNVNDDLTIPIQQQNSALLPKLNGFLAQSPIYDVNWNTICIPLADMTVNIDTVIYCKKTDSVIVEFTICNNGSKISASPYSVSIYNGNPLFGGTLISVFPEATALAAGGCIKDTVAVPFTGTTATFYVFVNDDGSVATGAPTTTFLECDTTNNADFVAINVPQLLVVVTGDTTICNGENTALTATGGNAYVWHLPAGLSDTVGTSVTANPSSLTTYTIIGRDTITGCKNTTTITIHVSPVPVAKFSCYNVCLHQPINFNDSSAISSGIISSRAWDFGDGTLFSTLVNPNHTYTSAGTFTVSLIIISDNGCRDTITKNVIVHPLPVAQYSTTNVCEGTTTQFTNLSTIPASDTIFSSAWSFGDGSPLSIGQNATHLFVTGSYPVTLVVISTFGCVDSITKTSFVNPNPVVVFSSDTIGCEPFCTTFHNTSTGNNAQWLWSLGDGSPSSNSQDLVHCYVNDSLYSPVFYSPSLTVTSDSGCVTTLVKNNYIAVYPSSTANFNVEPQTVSITDPSISITNLSVGATVWSWNFGDGTSSSVQQPLSHLYADTGTYTIMMITSTQYNCRDTAYETIIVEPDFIFYIPNAFTPDGDGINDTFTGKGIFIKEFQMMIFDRWGNMIFETVDIQRPWDGKANHGEEMAQRDVYVYVVKVTDFKNKKHNYRGIVTLVR